MKASMKTMKMEKRSKGLVHVYTGDGKGKTTSAVGLAMRAIGVKHKVFMVQFLKSYPSGELKTLLKLKPDIQVFRFDKQRDFVWNLNQEERAELAKEVAQAFGFVRDTLANGSCDLLILDEIMGVLTNGFIKVEELVEAIKNKSEHVEVVMTGRNCPKEIVEISNYVTEMKMIKHPYQEGISARQGIEY